MKIEKKLTIIAIILLTLVIIAASFIGIYKYKGYSIKNVVPKYLLSMNFENTRNLKMTVDDSVVSKTVYDSQGNEVTQEEGVEYSEEDGYKTVENKANSEEQLTEKNYKMAKSIIIKRLNASGIEQYVIRQNSKNGEINVQIPENDNTDDIISLLSGQGKFELSDSDTKEVLMNNSDIKDVKVVYGQIDATNTTVYLQIQFNKIGSKKLEDISKKYIETTTQVTNENGETEDKTETKKVSIAFDGETYRTTYFGETMTEGTLNVAVGAGKDSKELEKYIKTANQISILLNNGLMPLKYAQTQSTLSQEIGQNYIDILIYIGIAILVILFIINVFKFKLNGLISSLLQIGFVALLLLTIRYTNVVISLEGMIGILIIVLLNFIFNYLILKDIDNSNKTILKLLTNLVPLYIIAAIFTFEKTINIASLGMILFWGIAIIFIYNLLITKTILKLLKK